MKKRGQVSLEYLMLIGFVFIALVPAMLLAYNAYKDNQDIIAIRQAKQASEAIIQESEAIYYLGPPSMSTIKVYVPGQIFEVVVDDFELTMRVRTSNGIDDVSTISRVNITGVVPSTQGSHIVTVSATGTQVIIS
jgi:ABC-type glycerol-3-phosphate transport system permease component